MFGCLVPGVQLDFELFLNPNSIYLMGTPNKGTLVAKKFPAIHNEDIKVTLLMRKVALNASVYVRLQKERELGKKIVRYPVVRSEIRTFYFDGRTTQWEQDNVFVGRSPTKTVRAAYIVNTDPVGESGQLWLGLWTEQNNGLPLHVYKDPYLHQWWSQWKYLTRSDITLQGMDSQTCAHYALYFSWKPEYGQFSVE